MKQEGIYLYMDKKETVKEPSEDTTRESLIAISYRVPDTEPPADHSPNLKDGENVPEPQIRDGDEKYRSELISISCSPSPDVKVLPLLPGQP